MAFSWKDVAIAALALGTGCSGSVATDPSTADAGSDSAQPCPSSPPTGPCAAEGVLCRYPDQCKTPGQSVPAHRCTGGAWATAPDSPCDKELRADGCPVLRPENLSVCPEADKYCKYVVCSPSDAEEDWIHKFLCQYDETGKTTRWMVLKVGCNVPGD